MKTHDLIQGSTEWLAYRSQHFNASDCPAMLGCNPHESRSQLLHRLHTGIGRPIDAATQRIFDEGHRIEVLARPLAVKIVGEGLYPVVGSSGKLSASFDGLTMDECTAFEHKTLNADLRAALVDDCLGSELPLQYRAQMEHQCMVSGSSRVLFMASKWDGDELVEVRHCWYTPDAELLAQIGAAWNQFEVDLALYIPIAAAPVVVAAAVAALPAVIVTVSGGIQVTNNLALFQTALMDFIEHRLILNPSTDQDFADQDVQIKAMLAAEAALDAVEVSMLAQVSEVDSVLKLKQMLVKLVRDNRLKAQKQLAARKDEIRSEIVTGGFSALREHVAALNKRIGKSYMPVITSDFAGAIKGKRTVASLHDAVNTELARAKIDASATADRIQANMATLSDLAGEYGFLFADASEIVRKAPDDLTLLVKARIADHQAAEAAKEETTRLRIRAEEQVKAERAARMQVAYEADAKCQAEMVAFKRLEAEEIARLALANRTMVVAAANVVPIARPAPAIAPLTPPTLKLGQIGERLGFDLTANFLHSLGFEPAALVKNAVLFHEADFSLICAALVAHIQAVQFREVA